SVVTISRAVGSGGDEIAQLVCERLEYRYLDKWLLVEVATEAGFTPNDALDFSEQHYKARSLWESLFGPRQRVVARIPTRQRDSIGKEGITVEKLSELDCIALVRAAILKAHERGNMVIIGRGGQAILQDQPDVLHVRITAPLPQRIKRIQAEEGLSPSRAAEFIARRDHATQEYLRRFFDINWEDVDLYHLTLNTGKLALEDAGQTIVAAVHHLHTLPVAA
ncbi:MAG: cytidylate kinase-like family protein, partial [Anaerolineae bacterium]|nr:cytidylate kinase-like family protein [Anaerolineae bacterium]